MSTNPNPLLVRPGDIVTLFFPHYGGEDGSPFDARIDDVVERYGSYLIEFSKLDGTRHHVLSDTDCCDVGFITKIVERGRSPRQYVRNKLFKTEIRRSQLWELSPRAVRTGNYYSGHVNSLTHTLLSRIPHVEVRYGINYDKLLDLWCKDGCPGSSRRDDYHPLRVKVFKKWLIRNIARITLTKKEWMLREKKDLERQDKMMQEDIQLFSLDR